MRIKRKNEWELIIIITIIIIERKRLENSFSIISIIYIFIRGKKCRTIIKIYKLIFFIIYIFISYLENELEPSDMFVLFSIDLKGLFF
jgi:hypothetical protein